MKIWSALAVTLLYAGHATAHHAEAVFHHSTLQSVTGTVKEFLWANPHALIYLEVADASGKTDVNVFDGGSVIAMRRSGWSGDSIKVGDKLTIAYYPRRDKKPGGMLVTATLTDGRTLGWQPAALP